MAVQLNLKPVIDLPVYQWLRFLPTFSTTGSGPVLINDERGTDRFIYMLLTSGNFVRYDTYTDSFQYLAGHPSLAWGSGVAMTYCPNRNEIYLFAPLSSSPYNVFAKYSITTNTWTTLAAVPGLSSQWGTDAWLVHTCSAYNSSGNDDYIYLIGNNSTTWYRYSISGNSWTTMSTSLPAAAGAGCSLIWPWDFDADKLYFIRGGGTASIYVYSFSSNSWTTLSYQPASETFGAGSSAIYVPGQKRIYITKDTTHRIYYLELSENRMYPGGMWPYASGSAVTGRAMAYVKSPDGAEYIYYRRHSGAELFRMLIGWF